MERNEMRSAAARLGYRRGLLYVPLGLWFATAGLGNLRWGPFRNNVFFIACVLLWMALLWAIYRYYDNRYGRVTASTWQVTQYTATSLVSLAGGVFLDFQFDLPVSLFASVYAVALFASAALTGGIALRHVVVWGSLLVVALIPMWGGLHDRVSVALLPIAAATIIAGILDHLALVREFGAQTVNIEGGDDRA